MVAGTERSPRMLSARAPDGNRAANAVRVLRWTTARTSRGAPVRYLTITLPGT